MAGVKNDPGLNYRNSTEIGMALYPLKATPSTSSSILDAYRTTRRSQSFSAPAAQEPDDHEHDGDTNQHRENEQNQADGDAKQDSEKHPVFDSTAPEWVICLMEALMLAGFRRVFRNWVLSQKEHEPPLNSNG